MSKFTLLRVIPPTKYYEVSINAVHYGDVNISTTTQYTQEEFDVVFAELVNLRVNYSKDYQLEDYLNELELEIPSSDCGFCHTLLDLTVRLYDTDGFIYEVLF